MPSYDFKNHTNDQSIRAIRAASCRYKNIVGMDTGAWLLASAGLLDGRCATIHWDELNNLAEKFPQIKVSSERFIKDGSYITCGGVTTAFDLILSLIREQHGVMLSIEVAGMFMHGIRNEVSDLRPVEGQLVNDAVTLMRKHVEQPLKIPDIAQLLGVSPRKLEATFRTHTGLTAQSIYKSIRLREARRLASSTNYSITEIAMRCGYGDPAALTRAFQLEFGNAPSFYRGRKKISKK